jgi:hypothetical protein
MVAGVDVEAKKIMKFCWEELNGAYFPSKPSASMERLVRAIN